MLVYHPAFDIYNCAFRILQIMNLMKQDEIEVDRLRIWDFYLTFPNEARKITFPNDLAELKKVFKSKSENPYEDLMDPKRIIERMEPYQTSALRCLVSYGLIDGSSLSKSVVKRTEKDIPAELAVKLSDLSKEKLNIIKLILGFRELPLYGKVGLKFRTGLIDFKYDAK
ncbi:hypothetical protein SAMN04487995_6137 [Dyadobacter koreensis]|uniref:Uncharacterized protein n=1 Tax=Dyadobacter koreensis TaxID=408657 RepID=A0A1H7B687_9BACT|nr:ABC-three component system middle component 5 [Dyadobacter koreensis]SEJ72656.1 hypothetical protein SAMN04487995_6137 [Dyadobacter koreensis]